MTKSIQERPKARHSLPQSHEAEENLSSTHCRLNVMKSKGLIFPPETLPELVIVLELSSHLHVSITVKLTDLHFFANS